MKFIECGRESANLRILKLMMLSQAVEEALQRSSPLLNEIATESPCKKKGA